MTRTREPVMKHVMKRFVIAIAAILVLCALWMGGWFYVAGQIRDEIAAFAHADGITQPRLACGDLSVGGMPFSFTPTCRSAHITADDLDITLADIRGTALFYRPFHIQLFATGPARIEDAFTGAAQELDWSNLHASLRLTSGALSRLSVIADDLAYADVLMGTTGIGTARRGEVHLIDATPENPTPGTGRLYDVFARLDDVQSPAYALADGQITLDGQITGLPDPALWGDPEILAYWQALDGEFILRGIEATAQGLALSARGQAGLTPAGAVDGTLEIVSQGLTERVAAFADDAVARMFLGNPDAEGVSRQSVRIVNGTVTVGILPVATLPPLF